MSCRIYVSLWVYFFETEPMPGHHLQQLGLDADDGRIVSACVSVLLNQCRVLSRNFTRLSLSSKTQCHVNRTVTEGPAFASCCLIMGEGFHTDLGVILEHVMLAQPSIVYHHYCLWVNLKHVTCGGPRSVLLHTCRLVNLENNVLYLDQPIRNLMAVFVTTNSFYDN